MQTVASAAESMEGDMKFCPLTRELCKHAQRKNRSIVLVCEKAENASLAELKECPLVKHPPHVEHLGI
jgi:hypothetical protein